MTFNIINKIHLYSAFIVAAFLLMYFLSGAVMILDIFPQPDFEVAIEKLPVMNKDQIEKVNWIRRTYHIRGEETIEDGGDDRIRYTYFKPGYRAEIAFYKSADSVMVQIRKGNFKVAMNDFHRFRNRTGSWVYKVWDVLYDLSCIALLVFAFTGVYLWWKLERRKLAGFICILISTGITTFTICYLILVC